MKREMYPVIGMWSLVVICFYVWAAWSNASEKVSYGNSVTLNNVQNNVVLSISSASDSYDITAASDSGDFVLYNEKHSKALVGVPSTPPLGITFDDYHLVNAVSLRNGAWVIVVGNFVDIQVSSSSDLVVVERLNQTTLIWQSLAIALAFVALWFCGLGIVVRYFRIKEEEKKN